MTNREEHRSLWRNRDFMLLWIAQAISQTAQNAVWYGILVLVQTRGSSTVQMSLAVMTLILPSVLFGLVAGAYVDRRDKRWVLIGSNALRAVAMLGYILFSESLALVYVTNFVFSAIGQFFAPAEAAMIPALVARRRLLQANSLFHLTFTASQLGGLVLLGPLVVKLAGLGWLFILVALSLALCAALLWPLPSTYRRTTEVTHGLEGLLGDLREVLGDVRGDRRMYWAMIHWTLAATLAIVIATLAPGFVVNVLGVGAEDAVFVLAPAGIGTVLGTGLLSRWGQGIDKHRLIHWGLCAIGFALGFLALLGIALEWPIEVEIGLVMATTLLAGLAFVAVVVSAQTIVQERAPAELRGRVFAVQLVLSNVVSVVPLVFLGELADVIGVDWTLLLVGAPVVGVGLVSARLATRDRLDDAEPTAEPGSAA